MHFVLYMPITLFIKYLLMTNINEKPFATLIVCILLMNKLFIQVQNLYGFLLMTERITILQTDCSSFVCWDNYSIHSMNKISVKI